MKRPSSSIIAFNLVLIMIAGIKLVTEYRQLKTLPEEKVTILSFREIPRIELTTPHDLEIFRLISHSILAIKHHPADRISSNAKTGKMGSRPQLEIHAAGRTLRLLGVFEDQHDKFAVVQILGDITKKKRKGKSRIELKELKVGDEIIGYKLLEIGREWVKFATDGEAVMLSLFKGQ